MAPGCPAQAPRVLVLPGSQPCARAWWQLAPCDLLSTLEGQGQHVGSRHLRSRALWSASCEEAGEQDRSPEEVAGSQHPGGRGPGMQEASPLGAGGAEGGGKASPVEP